MKKHEKRPRPEAGFGTRSGPRARAAQERRYGDPYAPAERPSAPRPAGFVRHEGEGGRPSRPAVITLDPDVARVFRDSATVNEALRLVMRLARFGGGRPEFRQPGPRFGDRRAPPPANRRDSARPARPARPRTPRFEDK
jgi:hypothetical protein